MKTKLSGFFTALLVACSALATAAQQEIVDDWEIFTIADTNGDGLGDVLWFSRSANLLEVSLMNGARVLAHGPPIPGPSGDGWMPVTATDFNGDGLADVIWTNPDRGTMAVWRMDGACLVAPGPLLLGPPGEGWYVTAAGDTNGDGLSDVVWSNDATDYVAVWLMDGTHVRARGTKIHGPTDTDHVLQDLVDTDGDGLNNLLWVHPREDTLETWSMHGTHLVARRHGIPGPLGVGWKAVVAADFNSDGLADLISEHLEHGTMKVSLLNGPHLLAMGPEIPGPGEGWRLVTAGDTNGDGMADAVWQKKGTRLFTMWLMSGVHVLAQGPVLSGPR